MFKKMDTCVAHVTDIAAAAILISDMLPRGLKEKF
jgi:hypothetical protein